MMTLLLVRHGQSTWNLQGRLQGQSMAPDLTEQGVAEAHDAARRVVELASGRTQVLSSDQVRAWHTAQVISERIGLEPSPEVRLREQAMGVLEGTLTKDLVALPVPEGQHIAEIRWAEGAESLQDVHERLTALVADLREVDADTVVLVSHGDTIRVLLTVLDGRSHREIDWVPVANGEVIARMLPLTDGEARCCGS